MPGIQETMEKDEDLFLFTKGDAPPDRSPAAKASGDGSQAGIPIGELVPVKGIFIDPDSVSQPKTVSINGKPEVEKVPSNIFPARNPPTVPVPKDLTVITPGKNGIPLPKTRPVRGKMVPVKQPKPVPALLPRRKDTFVYNIQYLDVDQGIISSAVSSVLLDSQGNLWFGTRDYGGLSCYDGNTFKHYTGREGLSVESVNTLFEDSRGNLWIGTIGGGVTRFDGHSFMHITTKEGLSNNIISSLFEDRQGNLWIGTAGGGVNRYDPDANDGHGSLTHFSVEEGLCDNGVSSILEDSQGNLWFGTRKGVNRYDPDANDGHGSFTHFSVEEGLCDNGVSSILEDSQGNLWFGTRKGATCFDGQKFIHFTAEEGLIPDRIYTIFEDSERNLWFGTWGGVILYDGISFTPFTFKEGLTSRYVYSIVEDSHGNFWFGTGGGLNYYSDRSFTYFTNYNGYNLFEDSQGILLSGVSGMYRYDPAAYDGQGSFTHFTPKEGLSHYIVTSMLEDSLGSLWIGTYGGVNYFDGQNFTHFTTDQGLNSNLVHSILKDRKGYLWVSTPNGVNRYNTKNQGVFTHFTSLKGLEGYHVWSMLEDKQGNLWFGTDGGGLIRYADNHYMLITTDQGLKSNFVRSMFEDSQGNLWFGTRGWVSRYDGGKFTHFPIDQNLGGDLVHSIIEDKNNNIWISSQKSGVKVLVPLSRDSLEESYRIINFTKQDGLLSSYISSLYLDSQNHLWIGSGKSGKGVSRLDLDQFEIPSEPPGNVHFTHIEIENQYIDYRRLVDTGYQNLISFGRTLSQSFDSVARFQNYPIGLSLPHDLNYLTFHFSSIDWAAPYKIKYSFKMQGLDKGWSFPSSESKAEYRNLPPGTHTLEVKAIGAAQVWSEPFEYSFTIRPPWWLTWWAKVLYGLLIVSGLYGLYQFLLNRQLALAEAHRLRELDQVKTRLYTNITHEFRTPLTVILGMIDKVTTNPTEWLSKGAEMIKRNGQNLLRLVNQMLDLSKLESGKFQLNLVQGDVIHYLRYVVESFHSYAEAKDIRLHFHSEEDQLIMDYDPDNLLNIVSNLLSNAVKFTDRGGEIIFILNTLGVSKTPRVLSIKITDTGIGIPADKLPHIFDRFYQADDSNTRQGEGTGIGLALTRELVKLMGGEITVKSAIREGTEFSVFLPIRQQAPLIVNLGKQAVKEEVNVFTHPRDTEKVENKVAPAADEEKPTALIVEDNVDVVRYLLACLESDYQVEVAYHGQEGIEKALEVVPDIIISDVMMPEKDGLEVCDYLKNDERTSHIPIVLLTAKADIASKIAGLKRGADVYLPKPFIQEELMVHLENLIEQRRKLQARYQGVLPEASPHDPFTELEDVFLQKIKTLVEDNLTKANFDISWLAKQAGMSRVQLFRKVKALTGKSPSIFVRTIRLQKAKLLLQTTALNISEIAYDVGFSDPAFFSKTFREEYGESPSEMRENF